MKTKIITLAIILALVPSISNAKTFVAHSHKIKGYTVHYNFFTHKKHQHNVSPLCYNTTINNNKRKG